MPSFSQHFDVDNLRNLQRQLSQLQTEVSSALAVTKAFGPPRSSGVVALAYSDTMTRLSPPDSGQALVLPAPVLAKSGAQLFVLVSTAGTVTVTAQGSTVNAQSSMVLDEVGVIRFSLDPDRGWFSDVRPDGPERLGDVADDTMLANVSGASSVMAARSLSAMVDDSSLEYDATGHQWRVKDGGIATAKIADAAATTAKLADAAVTTAKLADESVTLGKMAQVSPGQSIGLQTDASGASVPVALTGQEQGENTRLAFRASTALSSGSHTAEPLDERASHWQATAASGDATVHGVLFGDGNDGHVWSAFSRGNSNDRVIFQHDSVTETTDANRFFNPGGRNLVLSGGHELETLVFASHVGRHIPIAFVAPAHVNTTEWVAGQLIVHDGDKDVRTTALHLEGNGTPEGAVSAPVGSVFHRLDGGTGTSLYVKESGTGNTGWVAK